MADWLVNYFKKSLCFNCIPQIGFRLKLKPLSKDQLKTLLEGLQSPGLLSLRQTFIEIPLARGGQAPASLITVSRFLLN